MKTDSRPSPQYRQLQRQLAQVGYACQGSVFERRPGQQGSRYVWTCGRRCGRYSIRAIDNGTGFLGHPGIKKGRWISPPA